MQTDGADMADVLWTLWLNDRSGGSATNEAGYILAYYNNKLGTGARFWVFGTPNEFSQYCNQNKNSAIFGYPYPGVVTCAAPANTATLTSGNTTEFTLIFKSDLITNGKSNGKTVRSSTAHEAGHWLDTSSAYRKLLGNSGTYSSDGTNFGMEVSKDWNNLNNLSNYSPCNPYARPIPHLGTVFRGSKSEQLASNQPGVWICANNGAGNTDPSNTGPLQGLAAKFTVYTNVQQVLQAAWPYYFDPTFFSPSPPTNKELFAQEVEFQSGNNWGGNQTPDNFFINSEFLCSRTLVQSLMVYGQIPGRPGSVTPWPTGQGCFAF
jgi:hypothetical protein